MFRFLTTLLFFSIFTFSFAQHVKKSASKPPYRYIYSLSKEQVWKLHAKKYNNVYSKKFLSNALDSLTIHEAIPEKYFKAGYIYLITQGTQTYTHFIDSRSLDVETITMPDEIGVFIKNEMRQSISDVKFYTNEKKIELVHNGYYYVIPKEMYGQSLMVEVKDEFIIIDLPKKNNKNWYDKKIYNRKGKEGFVLIDKPKYHIGDTVFIKGYLLPSLLSKKATLYISSPGSTRKNIKVFSDKIYPDKNGSYTSYFVLPDTLLIDTRYTVGLYTKKYSSHTSFTIEDYHLDDFLLSADISCNSMHQDSVTIDITCTTAHGEAIKNGWIYFNIKPTFISLEKLKDSYVPYLIYKDSIRATGQELYTCKLKMPNLPYGKYYMDFQMQVNNNGLTEVIEKEFEYSYSSVVMTHKTTGHVFEFNPYTSSGASIATGFALYGNSILDTIQVSFPYQVNFQQQKIPSAFIINKFRIAADKDKNIAESIKFNYVIEQKNIVVKIKNPFEFNLRIKNNSGVILYNNSESLISIGLSFEKNQILYCEYLIEGEYHQKKLLISPDYKSLLIEASIKDTINPGGTFETNVHVSNVEGKSVRNVNLTAFAVDDRLEHNGVPRSEKMIQYKYVMIGDKQSNNMSVEEISDTAVFKYLYNDYDQFLHGDSINYFLIPETKDSITEAFIYVLKNKTYLRPGYVFEDGKPVYWSDVKNSSTQSFYTTPGYHSYEIRLLNETIFIDSIFIYASFKNNILIPLDRIPSNRYRVVSRPKKLTESEIEILKAYLYKIKSAQECRLITQTNFYTFSYLPAYILNADSVFNAFTYSDSSVYITRVTFSNNKKKDYLKRLRFRGLTPRQSLITLGELKTLEREEYLSKKGVKKMYSNAFFVDQSDDYATLYIQYKFSYKTIVKLIDKDNQVMIDSSARYYSDSDELRFKVHAGEYRIQVFNFQGDLIIEKEITIDEPGYYITDVFVQSDLNFQRATDIYTSSRAYYPSNIMYYKSESTPYQRSRRRRYVSNYVGVYGGLNSIYTGSSQSNNGYQFGALAGHQFAKRIQAELRLSYGKTALDLQQPYNYSYGKIGIIGWYSLAPYPDGRFNILLGTGISGQQILDKSIRDYGISVPVGASAKYKFGYSQSINLEVLWNKTISGTDYSYSNQGMWEVNLRFNFNIHGQHRVCCPSNFWGEDDNATVVKEKVKSQSGFSFDADKEISVSHYSAPAEDNSAGAYVTVRSNFYDRAYWVPSFKTDVNGNAQFTATYPDALTKWNNYIIAQKRRQSNTWQSQNTAYMKNYIQLYVPQFVIKGDTASATYHVESDTSFEVQNFIGYDRMNTSQKIDDSYSFVASSKSDSVICKSILFNGSKLIDGEQRIIPVYKAGNETYTGEYAYIKKDTSFSIVKSDSAIETKIYVSNDLQDFVRIQYAQLMDYPYACNEQTASKLIGAIAGKQINGAYRGKHPNIFYSKLKENMNYDGMYGWWGSSTTSISMSAYTFYALRLYYINAGLSPDKFYTDFRKNLIESVAYNKASYFTYWIMKESDLSMKDIAFKSEKPETYKEEILALRIRQLQGDTIKRAEIEKYLSQTMLGNAALKSSKRFDSYWYEDELLYLIVLHKVSKTAFPDIAEKIRTGLIEHGSLSEYTPTYVKALYINEFVNVNSINKNAEVVTYDKNVVTNLPFTKIIRDSSNHELSVKNASGMYVVKSEKFLQAQAKMSEGLSIDYAFVENGNAVSSLRSGTVVEQKVDLKISNTSLYVMVEIPIAAGCMFEELTVPYSGLLSHREVFRDKVILYFNELPKGAYTFTLRFKVLFKGDYQLNPCSVSLMYFPMIQTQAALRRIRIE